MSVLFFVAIGFGLFSLAMSGVSIYLSQVKIPKIITLMADPDFGKRFRRPCPQDSFVDKLDIEETHHENWDDAIDSAIERGDDD